MALVYAYSLGGGISTVVDFPLDTVANYKVTAGAGTNDVTKGDPVFLNAGLVRRAGSATAKLQGVVEGIEFTGLAQAGAYAATNSSFNSHVVDTTNFPSGVAKVRIDADAVYKVPVTGGTAGNANIGTAYNIGLTAAGDASVNIGATTTPILKVIGVAPGGAFAFVQIQASALNN
jgi:hypothetical protein